MQPHPHRQIGFFRKLPSPPQIYVSHPTNRANWLRFAKTPSPVPDACLPPDRRTNWLRSADRRHTPSQMHVSHATVGQIGFDPQIAAIPRPRCMSPTRPSDKLASIRRSPPYPAPDACLPPDQPGQIGFDSQNSPRFHRTPAPLRQNGFVSQNPTRRVQPNRRTVMHKSRPLRHPAHSTIAPHTEN
jgi:hypothetical protein